MKDVTRRGFLRGTATTGVVLTGLGITAKVATDENAATVHSNLGTTATKLVTEDDGTDTTYYASSFDSWEEAYESEVALIEDIQTEGSVLLSNDGALPLASGASVSLFSRSAVDIIYGGSGSGSINTSTVNDLKTAMENAGFSVNPTLWDFYENSGVERTVDTSDWEVYSDTGEVPLEDYTDDVVASYADYNDAAIVVLSRPGGEGVDVNYQVDLLDFQDVERELLEHIGQYFGTIIVVVNSSNALSLGWLDECNVNACLWIGYPGQSGLDALAEMLAGARVPSGKLADIHTVSSQSAPAMVNFGSYQYTNSYEGVSESFDTTTILTDSTGAEHSLTNSYNYLVQSEGIYIGYRYYETRYEDCVLGRGNATGSAGCFGSAGSWNYADEVAFSFGYGLSYTTFEQTLDSVVVSGDTATVTATVTNTGSTAGKDVVEVYVQAPYTEGGVEKSAIQLCGFAKTGELAAGASETVSIDIDFYDFASFDIDVNKCWLLDEGTYYLAIGNGAHEALNNVLAAKGYGTSDGMDAEGDAAKAFAFEYEGRTWSEDPDTGYTVTTRFEKGDLNYFLPGTVTYLSRADWQNTWPVEIAELEASDEMIAALENDYSANETDVTEVTYGADNGLNIADMIGLDFDDEQWDLLLDELTFDEAVELVHNGSSQTAACSSIVFQGTIDADGPAGLSSRAYRDDPTDSDTTTSTYCPGSNSSVVIASTWNLDIAYQRGQAVGEDGYWTGTAGWWGPGANTHRAPYSGRNFEYYSEDPYLGGRIAANDVAGAQSKGMRAFIKHYAANDVETNRHGLATFLNEQFLRELALKQFEFVVKEGKTGSLMKSYNRIGCEWAGENTPVCTEVLHGEWGSNASVLTDAVMHSNTNWTNERTGLAGGVDQWLGMGTTDITTFAADDVALQVEIREACHRILYAVTNTFAMNGMNSTSHIEDNVAWWQAAIYALTAVGAVAAVGGLIPQVVDEVKAGKKSEAAAGADGASKEE